MKVLHLIAPVRFGGGESLLVNLLQERREHLEEFLALVYSAAPFEQALDQIHIPYWKLRSKNIGYGLPKWQMGLETLFNLAATPKLLQLIQKHQIDLLHAHGYPACILAYLVKQFQPEIRLIYTHHSYRKSPTQLEQSLLGRIYQSFEQCTGVSKLVSQSMNQSFFQEQPRFQTIYNCIGPAFFQPGTSTSLSLPPAKGRKIFIQIGRFSLIKNHHLVIEALQQLSDSDRQKLLIIFVGDGDEKAKIIQQINHHHLEQTVYCLGAVPYEQIPGLLAQADFGLFPSENEGFGLGAAECLAAGLPVLSLDTELMQEVVGPAGIQVSRDRLHTGFLQMLEQGEQLKPLARQQAERYRPSVIKDQYHRLYQKTLQS